MWLDDLFLPPKSPAHKYTSKHKRRGSWLFRWLFSAHNPHDPRHAPTRHAYYPQSMTLDDLDRAFQARQASYQWVFSDAYKKKMNQDIVSGTHEDIRPPWED